MNSYRTLAGIYIAISAINWFLELRGAGPMFDWFDFTVELVGLLLLCHLLYTTSKLNARCCAAEKRIDAAEKKDS